MFWAAFSYYRRTSLYPLDGDPEAQRNGVTGRVILATLREALPTICEPGSIFIQDNAPTHRATDVRIWLENFSAENGIEVVKWPPYSPDLNPIENVWKLLKEGIHKLHPDLGTLPKNQDSLFRLINAAIEVWEELPEEVLQRLVMSMRRRMQAVIDADGWYTRY